MDFPNLHSQNNILIRLKRNKFLSLDLDYLTPTNIYLLQYISEQLPISLNGVVMILNCFSLISKEKSIVSNVLFEIMCSCNYKDLRIICPIHMIQIHVFLVFIYHVPNCKLKLIEVWVYWFIISMKMNMA